MFLSGAALLICKAHVNAGSVICHLRGSRSTSRVAPCICLRSSCSVRALVGGSETDCFFSSTDSDYIYSPHLIVTRPHTVKNPRILSTWVCTDFQPKFAFGIILWTRNYFNAKLFSNVYLGILPPVVQQMNTLNSPSEAPSCI